MTKVNSKNSLIALAIGLLMVSFGGRGYAQTTITGFGNKDHGTFDIDPTALYGKIGFRKHTHFKLSDGDTVNFIFKYGSEVVEEFVILVDDTITINGLVNSCDGRLVFISPNGMIVGASGILNVDSLSVLTPDLDSYSKLAGDLRNNPDFSLYVNGELGKGTGTVTINGKVVACETAGIRELQATAPFKIYSNPVNNVLTVQLETSVTSGSLAVFDISGKIVLSQQVVGDMLQIDLSMLSSGNYILRLNENGKFSAGVKFVKE